MLFTQPWFLPVDRGAAFGADDQELFDGAPIEVPYVATSSYLQSATLVFMFDKPVRVPPLRWTMAMSRGRNGLPWGYRQTRSPEGVWVAGLRLRVSNPDAALKTLRAAGLETPPSLLEWLSERHPSDFFRRRASWLDRYRRSFEK